MRVVAALVISIGFLGVPSRALGQDRPRPQNPPGTVTLSLTEYNRLIARADKPARPPDLTALLPFAMSNAGFRATVDGDLVRGTLRVDGQVYRRVPTRFPLLSGATIIDARLERGTLPIVKGEDSYDAVLSGPARFGAVLEWGMLAELLPGESSFTMPAAHAGSVTAVIDLPGEPADVRVAPGFVTARHSASGRTTVNVTLVSGQPSRVMWSTRGGAPDAGPPAEVRMLADVKSLWRIEEGDVQLAALVEITMIRGNARSFALQLPPGFEVDSVNGSSLESSESKGGTLTLTVRDTPERRHQFLVTADRPLEAGAPKLEAPLVAVVGVQRETGEVAVEAAGTVDVTPTGDTGLRRIDVRETHTALRQLAREPLLAAFRYQRRPGESRTLSVDVKRFPDAPVIAAVADRATATTLVTTERRTLTEIAMWVRNQAQPFVKVVLPQGATMLSVEVAGQSAHPVQGHDGLRVPLLRPGLRPGGVYPVSFVYLTAGPPFEKRGDVRMTLASIDLPIGMLEWELFVPDRYSMKAVGGNVIPSAALGAVRGGEAGIAETVTVVDRKLAESSQPRAARPVPQEQEVSQNVLNLQRRVAGVLPVRMDVPRTGISHRFVRPLVLGDETEVTLKYKRR